MSDQHSRHVLGCYGDPLVRTPNLDRLAAQGMLFRNAYCPAPVCCPSRMSFMTGRTPSHNRVWDNQHILNSVVPTWAHALGLAGYETSLLGRMHFVGADQYHGFENRPIGEFWAAHPGAPMTGSRYPSGQHRECMVRAGRGTTTYQWMDETITTAVCDYLRQRASNDGRPFAAVCGFVLPHCPYVAPPELFDHYYDKVDIPTTDTEIPPMIRNYRETRGLDTPPLTEHNIRVSRAAYYALVEHLDGLIGQILTCLDETGLSEDTLVVYTSDHGEMAGEHGLWTKNTYYEGSVGVPLIIREPNGVAAGRTSDAICSLIDLAPTFAEIAEAEDVPDWDGHSLCPVLQGESEMAFSEVFSELVDESSLPGSPSRMIRSGKWKLWVHREPDGSLPVSLFDLEADPGEIHDLADLPELDSVKNRLLARLYQDWSPDAVLEASEQKRRDYLLLRRWGQELKPQLPETLSVSQAIEDDVELL